jgi:allantoinase
MSLYDLIIRGGTVVTTADVFGGDIAIADGKIVDVAPEIGGTCDEEIDATGLHVFPGVIDAHVHFDEPGRTDWEGFATGTSALAAGGGTTCFDMPLNAHPPTLDGASFAEKRAAAQAGARVDFALWGGLVPGNLHELDELAACGAIGFKAFMVTSGTDDFRAADDLTLYEGMAKAADLGCLVAVHAENDQITSALARRAIAEGHTDVRDYLASRPVIAELEAIERAIFFAAQTGCALHIVHISTGAGVARVAAARQNGINVTCETCAHYLAFTEDDVERLGAVAKCAPPIRDRAEQDALWRHVAAGNLSFITSDHSPAPPEMRAAPSFFEAWGGIAGCQVTLPVLLTEGYRARNLPLAMIAALLSENVAQRFRVLPQKGQIAAGSDADLALVDLDHETTLTADQLLYRHRQSPYVGRRFRGRVSRTLVRGQTVFRDGRIVAGPIGRLVRPHRIATQEREVMRGARPVRRDELSPVTAPQRRHLVAVDEQTTRRG